MAGIVRFLEKRSSSRSTRPRVRSPNRGSGSFWASALPAEANRGGDRAAGDGPVQGASSGTDAAHARTQSRADGQGTVPLPDRLARLLRLLPNPIVLRDLDAWLRRRLRPSPGSSGRMDTLASRNCDAGASAGTWRRKPPAALMARGGSATAQRSPSALPNAFFSRSAWLPRRAATANPAEPPYTDPYVRWCGRGGAVRLPPIPIGVTAHCGSQILPQGLEDRMAHLALGRPRPVLDLGEQLRPRPRCRDGRCACYRAGSS